MSHRMGTIVGSLAVLGLTGIASAHPGHHAEGFVDGISHPAMGLDHVLAMVGVGLWAAQVGGRATWRVPAAFVSLMVGGGLLHWMGISVPMIESGILASVLVLGLLIAAGAKLPLAAAMSMVGVFAIFHGAAHASEMSANLSAMEYCAGFAISTAIMHLIGVGLGSMAVYAKQMPMARLCGGAMAACALLLWLGVM